MTLIMGPRRPGILARAADLGLAMQLTNIARDVGEDLERGRVYLPAELLREQLTRRYSAEIPYALTVEIERFEEEGGLSRIGAIVWVERDLPPVVWDGMAAAHRKLFVSTSAGEVLCLSGPRRDRN